MSLRVGSSRNGLALELSPISTMVSRQKTAKVSLSWVCANDGAGESPPSGSKGFIVMPYCGGVKAGCLQFQVGDSQVI